MNYLKYTQYAYIIIAVLFVYDGAMKLYEGKEGAILSFLIAAMGVFMFFFRKKFAKKFEDHNK